MGVALESTVRRGPPEHGLEKGVSVGRYVLLARLGAGAMGEVWTAWDPQLDRRIALKLVRRELLATTELPTGEAQARLLREAQAMAQLSHPNVVAVHDAGVFGDDVFLAMDLVDGVTLKKWLATKPTQAEVLERFLSAGRGLAAAHDAGLVHRDFKPDNVLVDKSGVVKVTDFGLARPVGPVGDDEGLGATVPPGPHLLSTELTSPGSVMGTPAYMSPEQMMGRSADARSDQFSFCVALYEALYGARPFAGNSYQELVGTVPQGKLSPPPPGAHVPSWLREVLLRGLSVRPDERWPSMGALLAALQADPRVARRRLLFRVGGVVLVLAVGVGAWQLTRLSRPCAQADASVALVWNDARRAEIAQALQATNTPFSAQAAEGVVAAVDGWTRGWSAMRFEACEAARVRGEQSDAVLTLRMRCLDRRLDELKALLEQLSGADAKVAERAVTAAQSLATLTECADVELLLALVPPPAPEAVDAVEALRPRIATLKALRDTGQFSKGVALAEEVERDAAATGYLPARAEALALLGDLRGKAGDAKAADVTLRAAVLAADRGHDDAMRAAALVDLAWYVGSRLGRHDEGHAVVAQAEAVLDRLGGAHPLERGRLASYDGVIFRAQGRYADALERQDAALALLVKAVGPDHPLVANAHNNRGLVLWQLGRLDEALTTHQRALAIREKQLGAMHPDVAGSLNNIALVYEAQGRYEDAAALHRRALQLREATLGTEHVQLASSLNNLAMMLVKLGEVDEALAGAQRALALREKAGEHPDLTNLLTTLGDVHLARGELPQARAAFERAQAVSARLQGPAHPQGSIARLGLARCEFERGDATAALTIATAAGVDHAKAAGEKNPEQRSFLVVRAEALLALKRPAEARPVLEAAAALEGGSPGDRAEVTWLLARATLPVDRRRARTLAEEAFTVFAKGGPAWKARRDEAKAWLAAQFPGERPLEPW
ncbi:MAG: tetratricopeptide repeat protein [Myxococcota bacterium]